MAIGNSVSVSVSAALQSARARLAATVETPRWGVSGWGVSPAGGSYAEDAAPPRLYGHRSQHDSRLSAVDDAPITATALLAHVTGLTRTQILARPETTLTEDQAAAFEALVARAALGEPLAYLTGQREFYGLEFNVDPRVLVPRPETERLIDLALAAQPRRVLDVGTGSGCIAVTLAVHLPQAFITASDISPQALAVARHNAQRHGVAERVEFIESDLLSAFQPLSENKKELTDVTTDQTPRPPSPLRSASGIPDLNGKGVPLGQGEATPFDLIAANLPYIDRDMLPGLPVARFEPGLALDGGPAGLRLIERMLAQAPGVLATGGRLLLEIGADQGAAALRLARAAFPDSDVRVVHDLAGLDRVLVIGTR